MTTRLIRRTLLASVAALSLAGVAQAAHESNNFTTLTSSIAGVSGQATVNYVKGTEGWSSTTRILGLPDGLYTFAVRLGGAGTLQPVCSFEVEGEGSGGCSDQDAALTGFSQAVIVDFEGNVVASGTFERRGGHREK